MEHHFSRVTYFNPWLVVFGCPSTCYMVCPFEAGCVRHMQSIRKQQPSCSDHALSSHVLDNSMGSISCITGIIGDDPAYFSVYAVLQYCPTRIGILEIM